MKKKKQGMEIQGEDKYFLLLNKIPFAIIGLINVEVDRKSWSDFDIYFFLLYVCLKVAWPWSAY